ncbi:ESX secretion-associated protein EspG [Mycobacterium sp. MUNTM1]
MSGRLFSAYHWDYLHRQGLVVSYPVQLGPSPCGGADVDFEVREDLLGWGVLEDTDSGLRLSASRKPIFDAFSGPPVSLFGTTLLYRDQVDSAPDLSGVSESLRAVLAAGVSTVPMSKFVVAATDAVVAGAVQFNGLVALAGIDCAHADSVTQAARLLWEQLSPGPAYESLSEMTFPMAALTAVSKVRMDGDDRQDCQAVAEVVLADCGVPGQDADFLAKLLQVQPDAAAQVCVSVWSNHKRLDAQDAAVGLLQFAAGAVLTYPCWRLDGSCYVTYVPATVERWEKAIVDYVEHYQRRLEAVA